MFGIVDRRSYQQGFEDALEAVEYLIKVKRMEFRKALRYLLKILGWRPRYPLEDGLKQAIKEWMEVLGL